MTGKTATMQRGRDCAIPNIFGDRRDEDLSPEMGRGDKIQRVNEESREASLRGPYAVISETSTATTDSWDEIRVMKTQMRSRWEIFVGRRDEGGFRAGGGQAKGSSDDERAGGRR